MKFKELEDIILLKDYPNENLKKGDMGVIVKVYTEPNEAYEVEFVDEKGKTKSQLTLLPNEVEKYKK